MNINIMEELGKSIGTLITAATAYVTILFLFLIVLYIIKTISAFTIAGRIKNSSRIIAFIPGFRMIIYAKVADEFRRSVGKDEKMEMWTTILLIATILSFVTMFTKIHFMIIFLICIILLSFVNVFNTYYYFKYTDAINAPIYMLLGIANPILMTFFIFHCRNTITKY